MFQLPANIPRCQHIKHNKERCGSPALRSQKFCYFHQQSREQQSRMTSNIRREREKIKFPSLDNAESIEIVRRKVMQMLEMQRIDNRTASLLLFALQIASANLKQIDRLRAERSVPVQKYLH